MKSLTLSQKIGLGFGALLLLTGGLGSIAVVSMKSVQGTTRTLAVEYAPEVEVAATLKSEVAAANLAVRSYGLTGDMAYLTTTRKELAAVHAEVTAAEKLSQEHPNLVRLRAALPRIASTLKDYEDAVNATEQRNTDIAKNRTKLDETAASFVTSIDRLIESQKGKLQAEIKAGSEAPALTERTRKLILAEEIRGFGNAARIGVFKAQALRDTALFSDSLNNFPPIETRFTELIGLLKVQADIDDLNRVKTGAFAYRDAVQAVMDDSIALVEIGKKRLEAANQLLALAEETHATGLKRTLEAADTSNQRLSIASMTVLVGIAASLAIGFAIAFVIIRSTTKILVGVAGSLHETSSQVTAAASQVATASHMLAEGATIQASSLQETSASLEEMSSMTKRNAESARQAKDLSGLTRASADTGAQHMQAMQEAMAAIKASSDGVGKIIKTIDEIAFQTNILALNAAVEAARAGEAGMGFAVVAEEVRTLAQRSAQSAKETAAKIEDAIRKSESGVAISGQVAESLADIVGKARQMDELVGEIATASAEQSLGITQLNSAVSQMDKVTQSNASGAEEGAAAAEELNALADSMLRAVIDLRSLVTRTEREEPAVESEDSHSVPPAPTVRTVKSSSRETVPVMTLTPQSSFFSNPHGADEDSFQN